MTKTLCIYHANCMDGFTAAWVVREALGEADVDFWYADYGNPPPPDIAGRNIIIVDFSYPKETLKEMARTAKSVLVIDHHKKSAEDLADLKQPLSWRLWHQRLWLGDQDPYPEDQRLRALFTMHCSGAGLAWQYFFPDVDMPLFVHLVQLRDLWQKHQPEWPQARELHAYITSLDPSFELWSEFVHDFQMHPNQRNRMCNEGLAILRAELRCIKKQLEISLRFEKIAGHIVPVANVPPMWASEAGNMMLEMMPSSPFAVTYYDDAKLRRFSLRSTPNNLDVNEIAKQFGGGGHREAAGFKVPRNHELARF